MELVKEANRQFKGFKVVIMDCQMPVMDRWQASIEISRMREQDLILYMLAMIATLHTV